MVLLILERKPEIILGVALANSVNSCFEPVAINRLHTSGTVTPGSEGRLSLFVPSLVGSNFKLSPKPTDSFCNYSMYYVQNFLQINNLGIRFAFTHIKKEQVRELLLLLN